MESYWIAFINEYKDQIPFKSLNVILEAFYWYIEKNIIGDESFKMIAKENLYRLMLD